MKEDNVNRPDRTNERAELAKKMAAWEKVNRVEQGSKLYTRDEASNLTKGEKKAATYMTTVSYGSF